MKLLVAVALLISSSMQSPGPAVTGDRAAAATSTITYSGVQCDDNANTVTTLGCSLTVPGTGVHTLVAFASVNSGAFSSASATCGTVSAIRGPIAWNGLIPSDAYAFYVANASAGSCTFTINMSTSNFPALMVADFAGANASTPLDNVSCTSTPFCSGAGGGSSIVPGPITTTNPGELVIGFGENYNLGSIPTTISGYTQISGTATSAYYALNYAPASGTYSPSFTGTATWVAMAIALKN